MSGFSNDGILKVKFLPKNPRGGLPFISAVEMSLTLASKAWKPLPPGDVKLNGLNYANWPSSTTGDVTLTWVHRLRSDQVPGNLLVAQDSPSSSTKEGVYRVDVLINGTVKRTWSNLTGTSQIYTYAQRLADDADPLKTVQFKITPINGSLTGNSRTTPAFIMNP